MDTDEYFKYFSFDLLSIMINTMNQELRVQEK